MRIIPRRIIRHCGQRAAQHARWGYHWFADGKWRTRHTGRVTKSEYRAMHLAGVYPSHVIHTDGSVTFIDAMGLRRALAHIYRVHHHI